MESYDIILLLIIPLFTLFRVIKIRHLLSNMTGMTIAMALGMSSGLAIGVFLGSIHPDKFLFATVISMLIGLSLGILCGMPFELVAVLDGLLSGVMGGMMGAMLGVMIPPEDTAVAVKMMMVLYLAVMGIIFMILRVPKARANTLYNILVLAAFIFVFYFFTLSQTHW